MLPFFFAVMILIAAKVFEKLSNTNLLNSFLDFKVKLLTLKNENYNVQILTIEGNIVKYNVGFLLWWWWFLFV